MNVQEILDEIAEKYPHGLNNDSVIRKLNQIQNELFRTTFKIPTLSIYNLEKDVFAYVLPFPRSNLLEVVVNGVEYKYQDIRKQSANPFFYFIGSTVIGLYPPPPEDSIDGLTLFYNKYPEQLTAASLTAVPELDEDFHMLLVYGSLAQIAETFADIAMVNNFTAKYNEQIEEFHKVNDEAPDYKVIEDVMGGLL